MTMQAISNPRGLSLAAFAVGIAAFLSGWVPFLGILLGAAAITLGVLALRHNHPKVFATIGIVGGSLAAITSLMMTVLVFNLPAASPRAEEPVVVATPTETAIETQEPTPTPEPTQEAVAAPETPQPPAYDGTAFVAEVQNAWLSAWGVSQFGEIEQPTDPDYTEILTAYTTAITSDKAGEVTVTITPPAPVSEQAVFDMARNQLGLIKNSGFTQLTRMTVQTADGTISKSSDGTPPPVITTGGLTPSYAISACETYADGQFPYGVKLHTILDKQAESYDAATDSIFIKVGATITNAYNAELKGTVECFVTGSNDAPVVVNFLAY